MLNQHQAAQRLALARLCALAFILLMLAIGLAASFYMIVGTDWAAPSGVTARPILSFGKNQRIVKSIEAGSAFADAGVVVGDILEPHEILVGHYLLAGEKIHLTVVSQGRARDLHLTLPKLSPAQAALARTGFRQLDMIASLCGLLLGAAILLRAERAPSTVALGVAFACFGYTGYALPIDLSARPLLGFLMTAFECTRLSANLLLLLCFARWFYEEKIGPLPRRLVQLFRLMALALCVHVVAELASLLSGDGWAIVGVGSLLDSVIATASCSLTFTLLWMGWSQSAQQLRLRYAALVISMLFLLLSAICIPLAWISGNFYAAAEMLTLAFLAAFSYAMLRHKVIDLGFAVNRAVVYGAISLVILITFGLAEWTAEHFLHFEDRKKSVLLDGGIALATYLLFHKIKHSVEHWVEKIFFRSWHDNEANLQKFVREAAYISNVAELWRQTKLEIARFSAAPTEIFIRSFDNHFIADSLTTAGECPALIDENSRLSLALQAGRKPIVSDDPTMLPLGALAAPVFQRGGLQAFFVIDARTNGTPYRPDEIAAINAAVGQVGHHYLTLRLDDLRQRDLDKEHLLSVRSAECAMLRRQLAGATAS